jgi:hypothetical protein
MVRVPVPGVDLMHVEDIDFFIVKYYVKMINGSLEGDAG